MGIQRKIKNPIGVMQGRLLPKYNGRYQAHPVDYWEDEFPIVLELGLDCIEFILDFNDFQNNPLMTIDGKKKIQEITKQTGIAVHSICADYLMELPLHSENEHDASLSIEIVKSLIITAAELDISDIVIPCVDDASIKNIKLRDRFIEILPSVLKIAQENNVNLALETDLNPYQLIKLIEEFDSTSIKVNYDIGNSASLGYNHLDDIKLYGSFISDVHIKDRKLGGDSVLLGQGNANIPSCINTFRSINYKGIYILQIYRDDEGLSIFKKQLSWLKKNVPFLWQKN